MSQLNFLEKLLEGAAVEWKMLGEVCEFTYGYAAKAQDSGSARFIRITDIDTSGKLIATNAKFVDISEDNKRYILKKNDLLMARTGATYGKTLIFEEDYPAIYAGFLIKLSFDDKIINPKFYWHFAQSDLFWSQANQLVSGGGQPQFNANALREVIIPIPSHPVQTEIVRILDAFTELTTELTAELASELTARKKQYNYYRDQLLSFEQGEVEWKTLGETCDVYTGGEAPESSSMSKTPTDIYKYPIFGNGAEVYGYTDRYRIDKDAVTISSIGANTGTIYFRKAHFTPIIRLKVVIPKQEGILPRYLFHALSSIAIGSKSSSVPNMNAADVKRISIPIPPLAEQERIVDILDKFDALTNSISEGLPREIRLRQKQYEHYRELLLSFPKAEVGPT
ncbi:type I restriction endonuclease subunit S [Leptospira interrogans serovar Ricardi]|nr:restriction endonuclease subunit S [Leptospira interrogans]MCR8637219.1 type I restriction endonuclease subunit S [Leptospira interrogans serovar Ricardi]